MIKHIDKELSGSICSENPNDLNLVKKYLNGDEKAFLKLHEILNGYIEGAVHKLFSRTNSHDMNDHVQDIWLKINSKLHTFKGNSSLKMWVYRIVYNSAMNFRKKIKFENERINLAESLNLLLPYQYPDEFKSLANKELFDLIQTALAQLSPEQSDVIWQKYFLHLSDKETLESSDRDISMTTIKTCQTKALKNLRSIFSKLY